MMEVQAASEESQMQCHGDGTKCAECGKHFSHVFYFGTHIVTHLGEKEFMTAGQCGMCGLIFSTTSVYQAHMQSLQSRLEASAAENRSSEEDMNDQQQQQQQLQLSDEEKKMMDIPSKQKQKQRRSSLPQKNSQQPSRQDDPKEPLHLPDSQAPVCKQKDEQKITPKSESQTKPDVQDNTKSVPKEDNGPSKAEQSGTNDSVTEELPRKRIRRAPEKYEILPEEKKRRVPKRKSFPPPDFDPEVEKYLQSLRDMGFSVAPDSSDVFEGSQMSRGREPLAKRGQGFPRGRGSAHTGFNSPPTHPMAHPTRPVNEFAQGLKIPQGSYTSSRGMMGMNDSRAKVSPHTLIRNSNQNFQSKSEGVSSFQSKQVTNRNNANNKFLMGSLVMAGTAKQEFMKTSPVVGPTSHYQNRQLHVRMPQSSKPRPAYFKGYDDYEDEIAHLINGDLEVMPVSGKATRGERLRQRQERLSQENPDGSAKKSVKYFPRNEKPKTKRTPKRDSSPPSKLQRIDSHNEELLSTSRSPTPDDTSCFLAGQAEESPLQITKVHSLQTIASCRGSRGAWVRGRGGRWKSCFNSSSLKGPLKKAATSPQGQGHQREQVDYREENCERVTTTEMGTVRNVAGRMEDLRVEARKKVEEMLAAPAVFLDQPAPKAFHTSSRIGQRAQMKPEIVNPALSKPVRSAPSPKSIQVNERSRGRLSSRFRGAANSSSLMMRGGRQQIHQKLASPVLEPEVNPKNKDECAPEDECDSGKDKDDDDDKDEIVDGTDIDGWTVSISKMSDSEGEDDTEVSKENIEKACGTEAETESNDGEPNSQDIKAADAPQVEKPTSVSDIEASDLCKESVIKEQVGNSDAKDDTRAKFEEDGVSQDVQKVSSREEAMHKPGSQEEIKEGFGKSQQSPEQSQHSKSETSSSATDSQLSSVAPSAPANDRQSNQDTHMISDSSFESIMDEGDSLKLKSCLSGTTNLVYNEESQRSTKAQSQLKKDDDVVDSPETESQSEEGTAKRSVIDPKTTDCQSVEGTVKSNVMDSQNHQLQSEDGSDRDSDPMDSNSTPLKSDEGVERDCNIMDSHKTDLLPDKQLYKDSDLVYSDDKTETGKSVTGGDESSSKSDQSVEKHISFAECGKPNVQCEAELGKKKSHLACVERNEQGRQDEKVSRLNDFDNNDSVPHKELEADANSSSMDSDETKLESDPQGAKDSNVDTSALIKTDRHADLEMERGNSVSYMLERDCHLNERREDNNFVWSGQTDLQSDQGMDDNVMSSEESNKHEIREDNNVGDSGKTYLQSDQRMKDNGVGDSDKTGLLRDHRIKGNSSQDSSETDIECHKETKDNLVTSEVSDKANHPSHHGIDLNTGSKILSAEKGSAFETSLRNVCEKDHLDTGKKLSEKDENISCTLSSRVDTDNAMSSPSPEQELNQRERSSSPNENSKLVGGCGDKNEDAIELINSKLSTREKESENEIFKTSVSPKYESDHGDVERDKMNYSLDSDRLSDSNLAVNESHEESSSASVKDCHGDISSAYPPMCSTYTEKDSEKSDKSTSELPSTSLSRTDQRETGEQREGTSESDSNNLFDDTTDNFSEIEKTCQQII